MQIKDFSKSTFIFDLIDEFQIFNKKGEPNPLTDETFETFCGKYLEQSKIRDHSLSHYLNSNPDFFRTFLPESKWTFAVAREVVWFYNELIISDPVIGIINDNKPIASKKENLIMFLRGMFMFKDCIEGGYMRFAGNSLISNAKNIFENDAEKLLAIPELLNEFEKSTLMMKKPSPINSDPNDNLIQLEAMYEGHLIQVRPMGMYIPEHVKNTPSKLSRGVLFDFTTQYQPTTREELTRLGKVDIIDGLKLAYKEDIFIVLNSLVNSSTINASCLFFRSVDSLVAEKFGETFNKNKNSLIADNTFYDCALPYLHNVPPESLLELRGQIPSAFEDFRSFLYETVKQARNESQNVAEFRYNVEKKMNNMLSTLEKEAKASTRKLKFRGINSILMLLGSLSLHSLGIGIPGAVINMDKAVDSYIDRRQNLKSNSMYFAWKAQAKS